MLMILRYVNMNRYINYLAVFSIILCLVLVILPTLKTTSYGANFMAKYQNILMHSVVCLVTFIQIKLFSITTMHPFQTSIFGIIFIIMLLGLTPLVEGSLFSWILWAIIIAALVNALRKWISRLKILYSPNKSRNS